MSLYNFVMYRSVSKIHKTGVVFMIFLSWVTAFDEGEDDKTLNLKIGFDLTRGKNGVPSLRIRNFEEVAELGGEEEKKRKRSLRADTSSESDKTVIDKIIAPEYKASKDSDGSDDVDTSGSDDDRRLSTKGISPDEFEPERSPDVYEPKYNKGSDSE